MCNLLQKVRLERILSTANITICLSDDLGNKMEIPECLKELSKLTELKIDIDLLDMSLGKASRITSILYTGMPKCLHTEALHYLALKERSLAVVLAEAQVVFPIGFIPTAPYGNSDLDIWVASGGEAPQL